MSLKIEKSSPAIEHLPHGQVHRAFTGAIQTLLAGLRPARCQPPARPCQPAVNGSRSGSHQQQLSGDWLASTQPFKGISAVQTRQDFHPGKCHDERCSGVLCVKNLKATEAPPESRTPRIRKNPIGIKPGGSGNTYLNTYTPICSHWVLTSTAGEPRSLPGSTETIATSAVPGPTFRMRASKDTSMPPPDWPAACIVTIGSKRACTRG